MVGKRVTSKEKLRGGVLGGMVTGVILESTMERIPAIRGAPVLMEKAWW